MMVWKDPRVTPPPTPDRYYQLVDRIRNVVADLDLKWQQDVVEGALRAIMLDREVAARER